MTSHRSRRAPLIGRDDGSILVPTGLSLMMLAVLSAFVIDYGILWFGRAQTQNAADAGALAGAVARAYDEPGNAPTPNGRAARSALLTAQANPAFGGVQGTVVSWDCPGFLTIAGYCVRVDVYRDGTNGSTTLPVYFAPLLGVATQGIKATATAVAIPANATDRLAPWAVPDLWVDQRPPADTFSRYVMSGRTRGDLLSGLVDSYVPPSEGSPGSGYRLPRDFGVRITLKLGSESTAFQNGWFLPVDLAAPGGADYRALISGAGHGGNPVTQIGQYLSTSTGDKVGPTRQGVAELIAQDPGAYWVDGVGVAGSCTPECGPFSPRVVSVPLFDPDDFQRRYALNDRSPCPSGGTCVRIANLLGFFVEAIADDGTVTGRLLRTAGTRTGDGWSVGTWAFLWNVRLVR